MPISIPIMIRWWLVFAVLFIVLGVLLTPIGLLNRWFLPQTTLLNANGNLLGGSWRDIEIDGKAYPLSCQYQRQRGLSYRLNCQSPVELEATLQPRGLNRLRVSDTTLSGDLSNLQTWLGLLGLPKGVSGEIGLRIETAEISDKRLNYLQISGGGQQLGWQNQVLVPQINLTTLSAEQKTGQPITIALSTPTETTDTEKSPSVYLETQLPDNQYQTTGEISGQGLGQYADFLQFFGRQTQNNTFVVDWQGTWF